MTERNMQKALEEAKRVVSLIESDALTEEQKKAIQTDSIANFNENVNPGWLEYRKSVSTDAAFVEWEDEGDVFRDLNGVEFIDCLGGFGIFACGHGNPEIKKTVTAQLNRYSLHSQELVDPLRGYLANLLGMITPGDLQYCFFTNGGAEAVEMALKLARLATGGRWYISTVGAFHGKSMGAISMGGKGAYREDYIPMVQQVQHVKFGDAEAAKVAIENLEAVGEKVAGVIVEPIQGEAGVIIPPDGYLKALREICDEHGVALIFDEIQVGLGRTGTMWRCDHEGVCPDIMTYGKASSGVIGSEQVLPLVIHRKMAGIRTTRGNRAYINRKFPFHAEDGNPSLRMKLLHTVHHFLSGMHQKIRRVLHSRYRQFLRQSPRLRVERIQCDGFLFTPCIGSAIEIVFHKPLPKSMLSLVRSVL